MKVALIILGVILLTVALDRLARWAERRGRIDHSDGDGGGSSSATGAVMGAFDPIFNPAAAHRQAEERRMQDWREDDSEGAPPEMPTRPRAPHKPQEPHIRPEDLPPHPGV